MIPFLFIFDRDGRTRTRSIGNMPETYRSGKSSKETARRGRISCSLSPGFCCRVAPGRHRAAESFCQERKKPVVSGTVSCLQGQVRRACLSR
jgi:hypothetical protein